MHYHICVCIYIYIYHMLSYHKITWKGLPARRDPSPSASSAAARHGRSCRRPPRHMCVCVYIYIYIYIHLRMYVYIYIHTHTRLFVQCYILSLYITLYIYIYMFRRPFRCPRGVRLLEPGAEHRIPLRNQPGLEGLGDNLSERRDEEA